MSKRRPNLTTVELSAPLRAGLERVKDRDGMALAEQIRRAVRTWLQAAGIDVETLSAEAAECGAGIRVRRSPPRGRRKAGLYSNQYFQASDSSRRR